MTESIQKVLTRVRAPRVKITYDVEKNGAIEKKALPFIFGVMSDLYGDTIPLPYNQRKFSNIDGGNFNEHMHFINPTLKFSVDNILTTQENDKLPIELKFNSMDDFEPYAVLTQIPQLQSLLNTRIALLDLTAKLDGNQELDDLLTSIINDKTLQSLLTAQTIDETKLTELVIKGKLVKENNDISKSIDSSKNDASNANLSKYISKAIMLLQEFVQILPADQNQILDNYGFIIKHIAYLDSQLSKQLDCILHHPKFQALEGKWRGLKYLISHCEIGPSLKVRILPVTRQEIQTDLDKAPEFDQSLLFKKIYEEEFGTFGGSPFSCLIGDFVAFGRSAFDIGLLQNITTIAAASHAPFLGTVSPQLFDLDQFTQLPNPRDLTKIFESTELAAWNSFRESEDSRYCSLVLPRILLRLPYGASTNPIEAFAYEEEVNGLDNTKFCWGNPAYALAVKIAQAFSRYHWTASIRGVEGGGLVEGLPAYTFKTSEGDMLLKCPTEIAITDRREKELSDLGFMGLCHAKGTDKAVFFGVQTVQRPKEYNTPEATANSHLASRLPYMLNTSRFAHYIKMIMRDKIGSLLSKDDIQNYLQNWIVQYVLLSDTASQEIKAKYPLRQARVEVINDPFNPGSYKAILYLRPHFQMEELTVSLRLVANLPSKQ